MLPIHVALVPSDDAQIDPTELMHVAATLQVQLSRDFEPAWKIPGTVSAFISLDQVPPAYLPLIILPPNTLDPGEHAFHTTEKGTPIGLVEATPGWSRAASHELLEMVCDPQGKRKVLGDSLADSHRGNVVSAGKNYLDQGPVAYLLEICDPCQDQPYSLYGLEVADFVLPSYYSPRRAEPGRYSFTENVPGPLELLNGGYITWYTSINASPVWQAKKDGAGVLTIGPMTIPAHGSSRSDVDFTNEAFDSLASAAPAGAPDGPPRSGASAAALARRAARRYGQELRAELTRLLADVSNAPPQVSLDQVLSIVKRLINNDQYYADFSTKPTDRSVELTKLLGHDVTFPHGVPTQDQLKAVYEKVQHVQGTGKMVSPRLAATMIQGQT
jgi:hypothetical protein